MHAYSRPHLLPKTVRRVDDAPHALLPTDLHHLLPREEHSRHRRDGVDDRDDLILARGGFLGVPRGQWWDVRELPFGVCRLQRADAVAELLHELRVREREVELDRVSGWALSVCAL